MLFLGLALTCKTFGTTPSQYLGILDRAVAYDLDSAASLALLLTKKKAIDDLPKIDT